MVQLLVVTDLVQILKDHNGSVQAEAAHILAILIQVADQLVPMNAFPDQKDVGEAILIKPVAITILTAAPIGLARSCALQDNVLTDLAHAALHAVPMNVHIPDKMNAMAME